MFCILFDSGITNLLFFKKISNYIVDLKFGLLFIYFLFFYFDWILLIILFYIFSFEKCGSLFPWGVLGLIFFEIIEMRTLKEEVVSKE